MKLLPKSVLLQALRQKTSSEVAEISMQSTSENYMIKKTTAIIDQEQNEDSEANHIQIPHLLEVYLPLPLNSILNFKKASEMHTFK